MKERFQTDQEEQQQLFIEMPKEIPKTPLCEESSFLDPPRQLPKRSYSLQPDMANGWKPKKSMKINYSNVFTVNFDQYAVDEVVKELFKNKKKHIQKLVYLGPRKNNSYLLHEGKDYDNPYPPDKKLDQLFSSRNGLPLTAQTSDTYLKFDSDFEGGNLDAVVQRDKEFDLFMRVDSNTKGHTNWFYFTIQNEGFIGSATFHICNFRREKSLYQRGLRPYVFSHSADSDWKQAGRNVSYEKTRLKYNFLGDDDDEDLASILNTFFTMSFTYDFAVANDTVEFAYCIPYSYSRLLKLLPKLPNSNILPSLKSLSGLPIPALMITDQQIPEYNKKTILITGRIHPGQSNSSFVAEGLLEFIASNQNLAKQLRRQFIFYVIPMLNPDGVIAGNYRTSFFGKDLNRTYDQSRKYAFPQTFHLLEFVKELKKTHSKRFCLYIDLHGHSVKKNVFMYGPDFSIQHANYQSSRELPKIMGNITSLFRYYSCIFRISSQKSATARAIFNRVIDIPFTYTMQSSNGFYYDSVHHTQLPFTSKKWKEVGIFLCKALMQIKLDRKPKRQMLQKNYQRFQIQDKEDQVQKLGANSDDQISQGKSDSQPQEQDLSQKELEQIENKIEGKDTATTIKQSLSPSKQIFKSGSKELSKNGLKKTRPNTFLPPINSLNRAMIFSNRHKKKESLKQQRLRHIQSQLQQLIVVDKPLKPRLTYSQLTNESKLKQSLNSSSFNLKNVGGKQFFPKFKIPK